MNAVFVLENKLRIYVSTLQAFAHMAGTDGFVSDDDVAHARTITGAELVAHVWGIGMSVYRIKGSESLITGLLRTVLDYYKLRLFSTDQFLSEWVSWQAQRLALRDRPRFAA